MLQSLDIVAKTMHNDLVKAKRNKDYLTGENAKRLKQAAKSLRSAGLTGYHLELEIDELAWFVGGDPVKIMQLQHKLNQLSIPGKSGRLKEDGVYGPETRSAWNSFYNRLMDSAVPSLNWVNPLQPGVTGIEHRISDASKPTGKIRDFFSMENLPDKYDYSIILQPQNGELKRAFMLDAPHYKNGKPIGYHMNMALNIEDALPQFAKKYFYDHKELPEEAFLKLKNFKNAKMLRFGGRMLFVGGVVLDALELWEAASADWSEDEKLGHETISAAASIGGRWAGGAAGAKLGSMGGAMLGTALIPIPVVGTAIGGFVGGLALGIVGSFAEWVVDVTCAEE